MQSIKKRRQYLIPFLIPNFDPFFDSQTLTALSTGRTMAMWIYELVM